MGCILAAPGRRRPSGASGSCPRQQAFFCCLWPFGPGSGPEGEDDLLRPLCGALGWWWGGWSVWSVWPEPAGRPAWDLPPAPPWRFPQSPDPAPRTLTPTRLGALTPVCLGEGGPCDHLAFTADLAGCPSRPRTPPLSLDPRQPAHPRPQRGSSSSQEDGRRCPLRAACGPRASLSSAPELLPARGRAASALCLLGTPASWDHPSRAQVPWRPA